MTVTTERGRGGARALAGGCRAPTEYRVYGRTPGAEAIYWTVTTTEFVDTGAAGTSEAVPTTAGTVWSVKNIFELKNARNVVVEDNIFENHWKESQPGYAIVLTPRNSNGACTWCVVEHVRFEQQRRAQRRRRHQSARLRRRVPSDPAVDQHHAPSTTCSPGCPTALGGNGWFLQIGDEPRDVTLEHNTIDANGNTVVYTLRRHLQQPARDLRLPDDRERRAVTAATA